MYSSTIEAKRILGLPIFLSALVSSGGEAPGALETPRTINVVLDSVGDQLSWRPCGCLELIRK